MEDQNRGAVTGVDKMPTSVDKMPTREQVLDALSYGDLDRTIVEAAVVLDVSEYMFRKLMREYGIAPRDKTTARAVGGYDNAGEEESGSVVVLADMIADLDCIASPPSTILEAEAYAALWRIKERKVGTIETAHSITPQLILAIVRTKKYRSEKHA